MSGFTAQTIQLEQLPIPDIIEQSNFETLFRENWEKLVELSPDYDALVETDPAIILLQVSAFRELIQRQRINDVAKGLMLGYAKNTDLDHLGANFDVLRRLLVPEDTTVNPPIPAEYETDADFRTRIQLSFEGHNTAGPLGSYLFWALSVDSTESGGVKDITVGSPSSVIDKTGEQFQQLLQKIQTAVDENQALTLELSEANIVLQSWIGPGHVYVTVLANESDGVPNQALLSAVYAALNKEDVRPLDDFLHVQAPVYVHYFEIVATLYFYQGPDPEVVLAKAQKDVETYVNEHHRLGHDIQMSGLYAALHQSGVQRVELTEPNDSIVIKYNEVAYCTGIQITIGGLDE
jgi:phage-related baseplate assembly protein